MPPVGRCGRKWALFALAVDAKDEAAASFYRHHGFVAVPVATALSVPSAGDSREIRLSIATALPRAGPVAPAEPSRQVARVASRMLLRCPVSAISAYALYAARLSASS
jgi:hypothetical protein